MPSDTPLCTDHAGQLRYWAAHVAGQAEPMRSHLLAAAQELEQLRKDKEINTTNAATIERLRSQLELVQGRCAMLAALHYGEPGNARDVPAPRGKPCTCPDTSATACGVERGHKLGELWYCRRAALTRIAK